MHDGLYPPTDSRRGVRTGHSLQEYTTQKETDMVNKNGSKNGSNNGHSNGTGNGLVHINGNGHDPVSSAGHELLWDGLPPAVTGALGQPLDPHLVSRRKGRAGRIYDYLEGHTVIDQANRIFGYGGWGYELAGDVTLRQFETVGCRDRRGEGHPRLQRPGAGHRPRRAAPHRRGLPVGCGGDPG